MILDWYVAFRDNTFATRKKKYGQSSPLPTSDHEEEEEEEIEYEGYDGWYNNRAHPEWGSVESVLTRKLPSAYADGVYRPSGNDRPNPFTISEMTMNGTTGTGSEINRTAFMVFFGQQVVEEILDAQRPGCPPEYFNLEFPEDHPLYDEGWRVMPFLRSRYNMGQTGFSPNNPRQQLNEITPWIDGGLMYGINKAWADGLREFKDGLLAKSKRGNFPIENSLGLPMANPPPPAEAEQHKLKEVERFFRLGNPRGNENPFLLTFGILWFRWHNYMATEIKKKHPTWSDEKIFNEARKWVIASHQKIVFYDWLPAFLNISDTQMEHYKNEYKYDSSVHPGITHVFQSAAMRFGHTLVPPGVFRRNATCHFRATSIKSNNVPRFTGETGDGRSIHGVRTCNSFWNPQTPILESDIEEFLMGMASQICEREDNIITEDLRGQVFGPLEFSRRDLMAINIQRGRDHGLPDYNTARVEYGLERRNDFDEINPGYLPDDVVERLRQIHDNDINKLDIWTGGLMETTAEGPGELFHTIILDQFLRIRNGDRFWFQNYKMNGLFKEHEIDEIWNITMYDIIMKTSSGSVTIQKNVFRHEPGDVCPQEYQLSEVDMEPCTDRQTFDYFSGSEVSFALTFFFCGVFAVGCVLLLILLAKLREKSMRKLTSGSRQKSQRKRVEEKIFLATEWRGKESNRSVKIKLGPGRQITVQSDRGRALRIIEFTDMVKTVEFQVSPDKARKMMLIRVEKEYDLVLKFDDQAQRDSFIKELQDFLGTAEVGIGSKRLEIKQDQMLKQAVTKAHRQMVLERFFRVAFAQAFNIEGVREGISSEVTTSKEAKEILTCELTKVEFAEALSLKPNSVFVEKMFELIDKDKNGYVSFREFLDMLIIFSKGTAETRLRLFFDMYDLDHSGTMTREEFKKMIKSFLDIVSASVETEKLDELVDSMFAQAGYQNKDQLTFEDFDRIMSTSGHKDELATAQLTFAGAGSLPAEAQRQQQTIDRGATVIKRENAPTRARKTLIRAYSHPDGEAEDAKPKRGKSVRVETKKTTYTDSPLLKKFNAFKRYVENYKMHIFWLTLYMLVLLAIFVERAYYFSVEREHAGLRRIAGYGVTVTRGAASAMMFTYSSLLVTMCRNLITYLRETVLNRYIPFDAAISFHKIIAMAALFFTVMHCIGHSLNFYHIATQTANDLTCLFREFKHRSHELPKFHYWCWETITGLTGVALLLIVVVMYIFATQYARRHVFTWFWNTHQLYVLLYILMVLHGSGRLVQFPIFHTYFIGPVVLFTFDKLISISRKKAEIAVMRAELLPSEVTYLEFKRPAAFEYKSGQWVRIACLVLGESEYHPFTLTSAPHEENLKLHIRAVGPWTTNLRNTYDPSIIRDHPLPKLYLDGAFGEGHQDWYRYEVAVLVGGGIGVTPFASILKDIVYKSRLNATFTCKKVYFIWVTRTQKHYEWLTDIIREVEENDSKEMVSVHIFITQFYQRFDLRTTMLYVCERHFQKISNRSLFTGLKSITHFGRPTFYTFLNSLQQEHPSVSKIGVFSCGPPTMTRGVEKACAELNKIDGAAFIHHFENF
ncbi:dual oxidase 2-like isoform X2 [Ptychodera flava]|uniref:dual oxidase 2-like isoform X2 n=1 Tax=Ptychodera flava TaxID=63121 RepID=UPI00396A27FE